MSKKTMSDKEMEANKDTIINMLDEDTEARALQAEDYNGQFRKHESTPFQPPTTTSHAMNIPQEKWDRIFGKKKRKV